MPRSKPSDPLYDLYKRARNRLRRHTPTSILDHAIAILRSVTPNNPEVLKRYQPWSILLVIKWTLQEATWGTERRSPATRSDFEAVLNCLRVIDGRIRTPGDHEDLLLFLRHFAFQQFWLQQDVNGAALARQELLFSFLPTNHPLSREFVRISGVPAKDFMELAFATLTIVLKEPMPVKFHRNVFDVLVPGMPPASINGFLRHLSKSIAELNAWLISDEFTDDSIAAQRILPSPLLDSPLIDLGGGEYAPIFRTLFNRSMESVVYRTLRRDDPQKLGERFGPLFERFVGDLFMDAALQATPEKTLKAMLPGPGQWADFVIVEDETNVVIDVKGVEMSQLGRITWNPDHVVQALSGTAIKAIGQCMDMVRRLRAQLLPRRIPFGSGETYILIVSFDRLYLGSHVAFGEAFGPSVYPKLERDLGAPLPVPPDNVFFLSIDELERLLARVQAKQTTLVGALRYAKAQDSKGPTRKFEFQQHLDSLGEQTSRLPITENALNALIHRCILRLPVDQRKGLDEW